MARSSERGIEAVHTADVGLAAASDASILAFAREEDRVVVTLDADLVVLVLNRCREDLENGAMVSTNGARVRVRRLVATR